MKTKIKNLQTLDRVEYFVYLFKKQHNFALPGVTNCDSAQQKFWEHVVTKYGKMLKIENFDQFKKMVEISSVIQQIQILGKSFLFFCHPPDSWGANLAKIDSDFLQEVHNAVHELLEIDPTLVAYVYPESFREPRKNFV